MGKVKSFRFGPSEEEQRVARALLENERERPGLDLLNGKAFDVGLALDSVYTEIHTRLDGTSVTLIQVRDICAEAWRAVRLMPEQVTETHIGPLTSDGNLRRIFFGDGITYWYGYVQRETRLRWCAQLIVEYLTQDCRRHTQREKLADLGTQLILEVRHAKLR